MDGASFDRLSRIVHRLRHQATRRQALRTLAVGGFAGLLTRLGTEGARAACTQRRHRCSRDGECCGHPDRDIVCDPLPPACDRNGDRCCGRSDASCTSPCDCCKGLTCGGGRCRASNDGGGTCGGKTCRRGWNCCTISGFSSNCIDPDQLRCCRSSICERGGDCCDSTCCSKGWKCCGDGRCCPDGWRCGRTVCFASQTADISAESAKSVPFAEPVKSDERRWIELGWMTAPRPE
jgi:hypothetical protein